MIRNPVSETRGWHSLADLLCDDRAAPVGLMGAPLAERSLTPGRCDLAPGVLRRTLPRLSSYDLEVGLDLSSLAVFDAGDLDLRLTPPSEALAPVRERMAALCDGHGLAIMIGGNTAVTRPGVLGLDPTLERVALLTLDAHHDMRDTDLGLTNGNPIAALIEDGLAGSLIAQVGLQPFANTARMHRRAKEEGITVRTMADVRARGLVSLVDEMLEQSAARADVIYVDFDIDVIARHEAPGAPGARAGGVSALDFFAAARRIAAHPKVRAVDLTEFDPSLDVSDITAFVAARWFGEILAGFASR